MVVGVPNECQLDIHDSTVWVSIVIDRWKCSYFFLVFTKVMWVAGWCEKITVWHIKCFFRGFNMAIFAMVSHDRPKDCRKKKEAIQKYIFEKPYSTSRTCISINFVLDVTKE